MRPGIRRIGRSPGWRAAQQADDRFITNYAKENSLREDLAESALFAYTLLHHPTRIPEDHAARIHHAIPARIAFVRALLPPQDPIFQSVGPKYACDGSGKTFTVADESPIKDPLATFPRPPESPCRVNLDNPGEMSDILSNALIRGLGKDESQVRAFLDGAADRFVSGEELLLATANHFTMEAQRLRGQVQQFLHCNCTHTQ